MAQKWAIQGIPEPNVEGLLVQLSEMAGQSSDERLQLEEYRECMRRQREEFQQQWQEPRQRQRQESWQREGSWQDEVGPGNHWQWDQGSAERSYFFQRPWCEEWETPAEARERHMQEHRRDMEQRQVQPHRQGSSSGSFGAVISQTIKTHTSYCADS